jgi:hypothetical protein
MVRTHFWADWEPLKRLRYLWRPSSALRASVADDCSYRRDVAVTKDLLCHRSTVECHYPGVGTPVPIVRRGPVHYKNLERLSFSTLVRALDKTPSREMPYLMRVTLSAPVFCWTSKFIVGPQGWSLEAALLRVATFSGACGAHSVVYQRTSTNVIDPSSSKDLNARSMRSTWDLVIRCQFRGRYLYLS